MPHRALIRRPEARAGAGFREVCESAVPAEDIVGYARETRRSDFFLESDYMEWPEHGSEPLEALCNRP